MPQTDKTHLETRVSTRHQAGRPYHYAALSQEERIRRVFGLSDDVSLPAVDDHSLATYYEYLAANLSLPFEALYCPTGGKTRHLIHYIRVLELTHPNRGNMHNHHGLFCKTQNTKGTLDMPLAELGVRDDNPNCQLIDDYAYWFVNWR